MMGLSNGQAAGCADEGSRPIVQLHGGIVSVPSHHSVDQSVDRIEQLLQVNGVPLFTVIDHSGGAAKVGLVIPPTKLLIFGSPKAGTPLMLAAPSLALDLPMKILVWQDSHGKVWLSYNSLEYLQERHGVPRELISHLAVIETLAAKAAE
jgi:uncharacterized protein (DUF302 family)